MFTFQNYKFIIALQMLAKPLSYISDNLTDFFLRAVEQFQQIVDLTLKDPSSDKKLPIYKGSNQSLIPKKMEELQSGHNKNVSVQLIISRMINCSHLSFLLASETVSVGHAYYYYCLIVISPKSLVQKWEQQMGLNMNLLIKQPYIQAQLVNSMKICVTRLQNIVLQPVKRWKDKTEDLKVKGNQLFNEKDYRNALLHYEYALACVDYINNRRLRSILYANASACLYEMKLYDSALRYANLSIKIDNNYPKGYFRKITALLQKKKFKQIPPLLLAYSSKVDIDQLITVNCKYTTYVANQIGVFNWPQIIKQQRNENTFCDYLSKKVVMQEKNGRNLLICRETIQPNEFIAIAKPIYLLSKKKQSIMEMDMESYYTQFLRHMLLQQSFQKQMARLFYHRDNFFDTQLKGLSIQQYKAELITKFQHNLTCVRDILKKNNDKYIKISDQEPKTYGIWPILHSFEHSCIPNCSYGFLRNCLVVTSTKKLSQGTPLLIDYVSYQNIIERKSILQKKYKIKCSCRACEWEWWPKNSDQYIQIMDIIKDLDTSLIKKQVFGLFLKNGSTNDKNFSIKILFQDALNRLIEQINNQTHWSDIFKLKQLCRSQAVQNTEINIKKLLDEKISKLLRIFISLQDMKS